MKRLTTVPLVISLLMSISTSAADKLAPSSSALPSRVAASAASAQAAASSAACKGSAGYADAFGGRRTFLLRPDALAAAKSAGANSPATAAAWKRLFSQADAALTGPTYSVTHKTRTPPGGTKHDYMSMGPYWWPDPRQPNGEPYIRRDGQVNPERDGNAFDVTSMDRMSAAVESLSLAHYFSDDPRYARKAAELIRAWFLAPATRMNPNATYAQGVPGRTPGRAEGVLDTMRLMRVVEGIGLLGPANVLTTDELTDLKEWFAAYAQWMMTSPTGREERDAKNNHAIWFDYQLAQFSLFANREDIARSVIEAVPAQRFAKQIEADGKMPHELQRTRAFHYTVFALQAAAGLADLGRCLNIDLWREAKFKAALDFIAPYVGREREFPYPDLKPGPSEESLELFARAAVATGDMEYRRAAQALAQYNPASRLNLTIARP